MGIAFMDSDFQPMEVRMMQNDKEIKALISEISAEAKKYLGFVTDANPCAYTDRMVEEIIEKSKRLEELHNEQ